MQKVIIIGGGPTGLMAALLLARQQVPCVLIERHAATSVHPRARGLNVRTMEILRALGLEQRVRAAGEALAQSKYMLFVETLAGREIRRVPDDDLVIMGDELAAYTPCTWTMCAQDALEPLLAEAARAAGADLRFGSELVSFHQDGEHVRCMVRTGASESELVADYLLAADGAASPIRTQLGLEVDDFGDFGSFVNMYFRADLRELVRNRWFGLCFVENVAVQGMFLAVDNAERWLLNVEYDPAVTALASFTPERCIALIRAAVGIADLPVELISVLPWQASARVVQHMRVGRVFLAGDAAHTMPPAGGFGLNTGVQDAHNLAWKLAAVARGANATLLDSYEAERLPIARVIVERTAREFGAGAPDEAVSFDPSQQPGETDGAMAALRAVLDQPYQGLGVRGHGAEAGAAHITPTLQHQEPFVLDGRPGTRAPHVWLQRNGQRISTLDLFDGPFVLLVGNDGGAWLTAAQQVQPPLPLRAYQIGTSGDVQAESDWLSAYGIQSAGAVLVRPDGYIAWRHPAASADASATLREVLAGWI